MGKQSKHPDLAPYFLECVRHVRPFWVCRENVPHPDAHQFAFCLEWLGYSTIILEVDSANVTGQSRPRQVVIGVSRSAGHCASELFSKFQSGEGHYKAVVSLQGEPVTACLTTKPDGYSIYHDFIADPSGGLRVFTNGERARLQDFPEGYLQTFSKTRANKLYGNAVTVGVFEQILKPFADLYATDAKSFMVSHGA